MKRDKFLTLIENALQDPNSPVSKHWNEIVKEATFLFMVLNELRSQETASLLRKVARMRFVENRTDEEIVELIPEMKPDEVYKTIKVLEQNVADILLAVIADYLPEFRNAQMTVFAKMAQEEAEERIAVLNELQQEAEIRELTKVLEQYHKKYTINANNMGRKKKQPKDNLTIFDVMPFGRN